jgi:hypothetical protein
MQNNNKKKGKERLTKGIERTRGACKSWWPGPCGNSGMLEFLATQGSSVILRS